MKKTALTFAALAVCLAIVATSATESRADELKEFSTRDLEKALSKTKKELKTFVSLEKKLDSAGKQSSNTARKSVLTDIQDHMAKCITRREDDLGQEHTIKMHGEYVTEGTTSAAEVGAPVGTSRAKTSLLYVEGIEGYRLRQLSLMQSLFVATAQNLQPAIDRQGESLDRFASFTRRFREELERNQMILEGELKKRDQAADQANDY